MNLDRISYLITITILLFVNMVVVGFMVFGQQNTEISPMKIIVEDPEIFRAVNLILALAFAAIILRIVAIQRRKVRKYREATR